MYRLFSTCIEVDKGKNRILGGVDYTYDIIEIGLQHTPKIERDYQTQSALNE